MNAAAVRAAAGRWLDPVMAAVFLTACELEVMADLRDDHGHRHWSVAINVLVVVGFTLPLAWRRRFPLVSASVVTAFLAIFIAGSLADVSMTNAPQFVLFIPPYSVAAYAPRRRAIPFLAAFLVAMSATNALNHAPLSSWVFVVGTSVGPWFVGRLLRARRALAADLHRTTEQLVAERDAREQLAIADQRTRIAAELQTLVAHSVSEMIVHAQSARWLLDTQPADASAAMQSIEVSGRHTLTEMRRILGVLREPDQVAELAPQPGIGQIPALVERARQAGHRIALTVEGEPAPTPAGVDLAVYRIAEEALAALGRDDEEHLEVLLRFRGNDVELQLGAANTMLAQWPTVAMRERVALCHGDVDVEAVSGERGRLVAHLPRVFDGVLA